MGLVPPSVRDRRGDRAELRLSCVGHARRGVHPFGWVAGRGAVLRDSAQSGGPPAPASRGTRFQGSSEALRALSLPLVGPLIALACTWSPTAAEPGGGFQGGAGRGRRAVGGVPRWRVHPDALFAPHLLVELAESIGAVGYALIGLWGLVFVGVFFKNFLGLGMPGEPWSRPGRSSRQHGTGLEVDAARFWSRGASSSIRRSSSRNGGAELPGVRDRRLVFPGWLYGIVWSRNLIQGDPALSVVQSATYLLLLAIGYRRGGQAPIFADIPPVAGGRSDRPGAGADRRGDRGDGRGSAARTGGAGPQALRDARPERADARCALMRAPPRPRPAAAAPDAHPAPGGDPADRRRPAGSGEHWTRAG